MSFQNLPERSENNLNPKSGGGVPAAADCAAAVGAPNGCRRVRLCPGLFLNPEP